MEPAHGMPSLSVWEQCYYRWIPILEIKGGGFPQIDLFHRLLLSNIAKLQRAIDTGDFDDLPPELLPDIATITTTELSKSANNIADNEASTSSSTNASESINIERRNKSHENTPKNSPIRYIDSGINIGVSMPMVSSFFPFSASLGDTTQLMDILTNSNELMMEGSIMERLSIAQFPD